MENNGIFNSASSFNKFWNTKVLSEWTQKGVYSRNKRPKKIKEGPYIINLDEYAEVGRHWIALCCRRSETVYFNSFGVEHVPEETKKFIGIKNLIANILRVQANNSIICGYFCIGLIDFMLAGKNWLILRIYFLSKIFKKMAI